MRKPPPRSRRDKPLTVAESDFWPELIKIAVAQICRSVGFNSAQSLALEALTDIATRYLKLIAKLAAQSANRNSRTESNRNDVVAALEDLTSGFTGGPNGAMKELARFVKYGHEIPFAQPMPRIVSEANSRGQKLKMGRYINSRYDRRDYIRRSYHDRERLRHVPRWLPDVPVIVEKDRVETRKREIIRWEENYGDNRESNDLDHSTNIGNDESSASGSKEIDVLVGKRRKVRFNMGKASLSGSVRNLNCTGKRVVWC